MNRAGLLNFWYYDDEIFDFADGKLLLRGSNGSGKSVTMQSILPILLDGKKSPDRLDPFRSRARKMEDYLLGEKEIVDRDERTGYLFLEYKRANTEQYITTGIGLQARRNKKLNFWGFVITDNRRIGKDLFLYENAHHAGEKQQLPLSRIQLENRIDTGGHVVRTQGEYMKLVNKYIFGFETIEAYKDLIELLIQLRSPKLSKDFRPTVIYDILEAALPPLTDEDLRHLSDTIEHMDQTKQQIEQLEREQAALEKVIERYDAYNEYRLWETAAYYLEAKEKYNQEEKQRIEKIAANETVEQEIKTMEARDNELSLEAETLEKKQTRLKNHEVWNLEEEKTVEQKKLKEAAEDNEKKNQTVTIKTKQELQAKERLDEMEVTLDELESELADQLIDLAADADETSFDRHHLNVEDFERHKHIAFDFNVWKKEANAHYHLLESISEKLHTYEHLKKQMTELEKQIADTQMELDQIRQEQKDWENIFEKDKQDKMNELHQWREQYTFLDIDETIFHQASRGLDSLYEPTSYDNIKSPFQEVSQQYQMRQKEQIATKLSEQKQIDIAIAEQEALLAEWRQKRDPEPSDMNEQTKASREALKKAGHDFIPLYEAIEFQSHVDEQTRLHVEAALIDSGLLNALITNENVPLQHDRILNSNPQMMAHTLSDYVEPDMTEDIPIPGSRIDDILRSILIDADNDKDTMVVGIDGTYQIGLMRGHAVPVDAVRFIGRTARKRYREEEMARIQTVIEDLNNKRDQLEADMKILEENANLAQTAMNQFPDDADLQVSFAEIKAKRFTAEQIEKELLRQDQKLNDLMHSFQQLKQQIDQATRGIDLTISHAAYQEAKKIQYRYDQDLNELEKIHLKFQHTMGNKLETEERLKDLQQEVDELKGELRLLEDKQESLNQNITEIENQLQEQGMSDIREQIQSVQESMQKNYSAHEAVRNALPLKRADQQMLAQEIVAQQQKTAYLKNMITAWETVFDEELQYGFVEIPEMEIPAQVAWIVNNYHGKQKNLSKLEAQLTNVFYEQQSNLMEYRMTEHATSVPVLDIDSSDWTEDQLVLFHNWQNKASRRLIQLDFEGKKVSPYVVKATVETDRTRQQTLLNDQDQQLYEEILFDSVGKKLRSRIRRAQEWTRQMNKLMVDNDSTSGITFSIQWKPRTAETEAELDTKELVDLLQRDPRLLKETDLNAVMEHFRSKIDRAKEMIEDEGTGNTLLQVLKDVLDYRYWFSFVLSYQREGETKRELTNNAFYKFSGGEKAMAMYIPLFTACYSRYQEAEDDAPYIISLDEAFAGVDDENISVMFRIVEDLGFDYMMNSQVLWGDYDTVSNLAIYELVRPKNASFVSVIRYLWDGKTRHRLDEDTSNQPEQFALK